MKYIKYSPKGFNNIRAASITYAIFLLVLALIGFIVQGVGKRYFLLVISFMASAYFMIPGITVLTRPWFSQAWLNALHSLLIPNTSWEELSPEMKAFIVIESMISLIVGLLILALSILTV